MGEGQVFKVDPPGTKEVEVTVRIPVWAAVRIEHVSQSLGRTMVGTMGDVLTKYADELMSYPVPYQGRDSNRLF